MHTTTPTQSTIPLPALLRRGDEPQPVTIREARAMVAQLAGQTVTVDCETSGYPLGHPFYALRTVQVGTESAALVLDAENPVQRALAVSCLDRAGEIVAHSATADISLLALSAGRDPQRWWDTATDTMVLAALADQYVVGNELGLEKLSKRLNPTPYKPTTAASRKKRFAANRWLTETKPSTPLHRSGWANIDKDDPTMVKYAAADVLDTAFLRNHLPMPSPEVAERERTLHGILARVTEQGIRLDPERVSMLTEQATGERDAALATLRDVWGVETPGSPKQLAATLTGLGASLPVTDAGNQSVAGDVIEEVARDADNPASGLARAILDWRRPEKLLTTYLTPLGFQCLPGGDGRSHPTIHQLGARATGRTSSSGPNIQNIPRPIDSDIRVGSDPGLRGMFVADPGTRFISADFASVEVRLAAAVTGDETLCQLIRDGLDLHGLIVQEIYSLDEPTHGTPEYNRWKALRGGVKGVVFGFLYGAGRRRLAAMIDDADRADAVIAALQKLTPQLYAWAQTMQYQVQRGELRAWQHPSGRVVHFDRERPHKAFNAVVQGWGREVLVDSILRWEDMHPGCMLVPIHDELVIQVPAEHADAWTQDLVGCMSWTVGREPTTVPIVGDPDPATTRWGTVDLVEI